MHRFTLVFVVSFSFLMGCLPDEPSHITMAEGNATTDGLSISNGNYILKEGQPGVAFATVTTPGQSKKMAYFLAFNHSMPDAGVGTESNGNGSNANTLHTLRSFGRECTVKYGVDLGEEAQATVEERLSIDAEPYDLSEGRVFLINTESSPSSITQLDLDLPTDVPPLKEVDATQEFGYSTLRALRRADKTVDEFCQSIDAG